MADVAATQPRSGAAAGEGASDAEQAAGNGSSSGGGDTPLVGDESPLGEREGEAEQEGDAEQEQGQEQESEPAKPSQDAPSPARSSSKGHRHKRSHSSKSSRHDRHRKQKRRHHKSSRHRRSSGSSGGGGGGGGESSSDDDGSDGSDGGRSSHKRQRRTSAAAAGAASPDQIALAAGSSSGSFGEVRGPLYDHKFEAFNLLVDPTMHSRATNVDTAMVMQYQDLKLAFTAIEKMKIDKASGWMVQNYVPPCDFEVVDATNTKPEELCGATSTWIRTSDGHFVCDKHKPPEAGAAAAVASKHKFTGVILVGTDKVAMAVRAHVQGVVEGKGGMGKLTDFSVFVKSALPMMERAMAYAAPKCTCLRLSIATSDSSDAPRLIFSPQTRTSDSKKVAGLMVDVESMRYFPAALDMPDQININPQVTIMASVMLLAGFEKVFGPHCGEQLKLSVNAVLPTRKGVLDDNIEILSVTFAGGLNDAESLMKPERHLFSCTRTIKTDVNKSTVTGAGAEFAITRVEDLDMDRDNISRKLQRNGGKNFAPKHIVATEYSREYLVHMMNLVQKHFDVKAVMMFTGVDPSPLYVCHKLPHGGILNITVDVTNERALQSGE